MSDPANRWICVVGDGEAAVTPDLAEVSMSVSAKGRDLGSARDDVNARVSAVLAQLRAAGVDDSHITAADLEVQPEYDYRRDAQRLIGYRVARSVTARIAALDRLGAAIDGVVRSGANEVHGTRMIASDPSAADHLALRAAVAAARAKAEALADAAGVRLADVVRVEEEVGPRSQPLAAFRAAATAEAADVPTDIAAGELRVTRRVRIWFAIA